MGLDIVLPIERWEDTMVQALSHSLPGSLDSLCEIFKIDQDKAKDKAGKQLIQLFCKPRPANQNYAALPVKRIRLNGRFRLCQNDILAMRELHKRIQSGIIAELN